MGYPMTYQRLVNRNRLSDGDYSHTPTQVYMPLPTETWNLDALDHFRRDELREGLEGLRRWGNMLRGDLRRLERDAVDEGYIAVEIARRTGCDSDLVAAVLKEFMAL